MGASGSKPTKEYRVLLNPDLPESANEDLMQRLKDHGSRIIFVYCPQPLGFAATLTTEQCVELEKMEEIISIVDMEELEEEPYEEPETLYSYLCGTSRQGKQPGFGPIIPPPAQAPPRVPPPLPLDGGKAQSASATLLERQAQIDFASSIAPLYADSLTADRFLRAKGLKALIHKVDAGGAPLGTRDERIRSTRTLAQSAALMYKAHVAWRAANQVDAVFTEKLSPAQEATLDQMFAPRLLRGADAYGRPVLYFQVRSVDLRGLRGQGMSEKQVLHRYILVMEQVRRALPKSEDPRRGHLAIFDVANISAVEAFTGMAFWLQLGRMLEANYPETLGQLVVINAPVASEWAFEKFRSYLATASVPKVSMLSGDPLPELRRLLPERLLPKEIMMAQSGAGHLSLAQDNGNASTASKGPTTWLW